ncbi:MAG TPA: hypothetical protein DEU95_10460 [Chloroflexi bacterium]|jgi:hypothetical protein|nr:hypothetical protein [Chloroflexota bacterium]HCG30139.1 hypothetical protein [Chloroflexota bacterium]
MTTETTEQQTYRISRGEGYGGDDMPVGAVITRPRGQAYHDYPAYMYVLQSGRDYYREDGMSFGVGDESGYVYWADCRAATEEEAAPLRITFARRAAASEANRQAAAIIKSIRMNGVRPLRDTVPAGEIVWELTTYGGTYLPAYGGGQWLIIADDGIWYIEGHHADGDDWSANNIGGHSLGWRLDATPGMLDTLRALMIASKTP